MPDTTRPTVVERYRRHLDSPYGQELHDLAEIDVLACELRELVTLAELGAALHDEYGILRYRENELQPNVMPAENAALAVELRPQGVFGPDSFRPGTLMRRKATGWEEIPADVTPDDIVPGWSERKVEG